MDRMEQTQPMWEDLVIREAPVSIPAPVAPKPAPAATVAPKKADRKSVV